MLKNYIKIALKVMMRQKFFTAVSIFGISFTIMVFSITAGMSQLLMGDTDYAPNRTRTLYFDGYYILGKDGKRVLPAENSGTSLLNDINKLDHVAGMSRYTTAAITSYTRNKKVSLIASFTDEKLWSIYNFQFEEGRPYINKEVVEGHSVAVITNAVKKFYFGDEPAVGKYLPTTPQLKVIGVVKDFINVEEYGVEASTVFIPIMRYNQINAKKTNYSAIIMLKERSDLDQTRKSIESLIGKKYNPAAGSVHLYTNGASDMSQFMPFIAGFLFFMMLIPALNLMGLNINRIAERSSEIGIRKSFGASSAVLVWQFLTENIIVTFLGGIIGILVTIPMSGILITLMYSTEAIVPSGNFLVNWEIIAYAIIASIVFGILSGVLPAWKMSRLQAVTALKGGGL